MPNQSHVACPGRPGPCSESSPSAAAAWVLLSGGTPLSLQPSDVREQPLEQLQSQLQVSPEGET